MAAALGFGLISCGDTIEPLGPTPLDQGIVVYLNSGYRGVSQQVGADVTDLSVVEGPCSPSEGGTGSRLVGPHPDSRALGDVAPRAGRRRFPLSLFLRSDPDRASTF